MKREPFRRGQYYHIRNRGIDGRTVFGTRSDFDRFKASLYLLNDEDPPRVANLFVSGAPEDLKSVFSSARSAPLAAIGAYCILPTEFHLLITPLSENGIPKFMQRLLTAYTMYFNDRTVRSGSLFQGSYKSVRAEDDEHLKAIYAFIHLSPAKYFHNDWQAAHVEELRMLEGKIMTYPYSSAHEYLRSEFDIVSPKEFPHSISRVRSTDAHLKLWEKSKKKRADFGLDT